MMNWAPGSPRPVYIPWGVKRRSRSLTVDCPVCDGKIGHHCYDYAWTSRGYRKDTVAEFHQERIDLSQLCPCGTPYTISCDATLDNGERCQAPLCPVCAKTVGEDTHHCRTHAKSIVVRTIANGLRLIQDTLHNLFCRGL